MLNKEDEIQLYSPHRPEAYTQYDMGVGREFIGLECRAAWNLYWLSDPAVDSFLTPEGPDGIRLDVFKAAFLDSKQRVGKHELATLMLHMPASAAVTLIKASPHKHLALFKLDGAGWLRTIVERAGQVRGVSAVAGNISFVSFSRKIGGD